MDNGDDDDRRHRPSTSTSSGGGGGRPRTDEKTFSKKSPGYPHRSDDSNAVDDDDPAERGGCCISASVHEHMTATSMMYQEEDSENSDDNYYCIYTYRDNRQEPVVAVGTPAGDTSPLEDYLEMDFDSEPPLSVDNASEHEDINVPGPSNRHSDPTVYVDEPPIPSCSLSNNEEMMDIIEDNVVNNLPPTVNTLEKNEVKTPISKLPVSNTKLSIMNYDGLYGFKEECPGCLKRNADTTDVCNKNMCVEDLSWTKEMIWLEKGASNCEVDQIDASACGATAVMNTLSALKIPFNPERVIQTIGTRYRNDDAPLIPYLESRAVDGCIPEDLVRTLETVSDSLIIARFFPTHNDLDYPIAPWLTDWIKKGAIPILTLNIQRTTVSHSLVPDSWRHQMMYGIAYNPLHPECAQIYLTNPLSQFSMETLRPQLISPSTLLIRRADILSRWTQQTDLMPLAKHSNQRWHTYNVLGQVVNLLREDREDIQFTNHIMIPTDCKSGITLAMKTSSNFSHELKSMPEL